MNNELFMLNSKGERVETERVKRDEIEIMDYSEKGYYRETEKEINHRDPVVCASFNNSIYDFPKMIVFGVRKTLLRNGDSEKILPLFDKEIEDFIQRVCVYELMAKQKYKNPEKQRARAAYNFYQYIQHKFYIKRLAEINPTDKISNHSIEIIARHYNELTDEHLLIFSCLALKYGYKKTAETVNRSLSYIQKLIKKYDTFSYFPLKAENEESAGKTVKQTIKEKRKTLKPVITE